jgi:hypothetical protein
MVEHFGLDLDESGMLKVIDLYDLYEWEGVDDLVKVSGLLFIF